MSAKEASSKPFHQQTETGDEVIFVHTESHEVQVLNSSGCTLISPSARGTGVTISTLTGLTRYQTKSQASEHPLLWGIQDSLYHQRIEQLWEPGAEKDSTSLLSGYLCVQTGLLQGDGFLGLATPVKPEPLQKRRVNEDQTQQHILSRLPTNNITKL